MSGLPGFARKFSPFYSSVQLNSGQLPVNLSVCEEVHEAAEVPVQGIGSASASMICSLVWR